MLAFARSGGTSTRGRRCSGDRRKLLGFRSRLPRERFRRFRRCLHLRALITHGLRAWATTPIAPYSTVGRRLIHDLRSPESMSARRRSLRNGLRGSPSTGTHCIGTPGVATTPIAPYSTVGRRLIHDFRSPKSMSARRRSLRNGLRGSPSVDGASTPDARDSADFGVASICGHSVFERSPLRRLPLDQRRRE